MMPLVKATSAPSAVPTPITVPARSAGDWTSDSSRTTRPKIDFGNWL